MARDEISVELTFSAAPKSIPSRRFRCLTLYRLRSSRRTSPELESLCFAVTPDQLSDNLGGVRRECFVMLRLLR